MAPSFLQREGCLEYLEAALQQQCIIKKYPQSGKQKKPVGGEV
jgi:hypothetical protein